MLAICGTRDLNEARKEKPRETKRNAMIKEEARDISGEGRGLQREERCGEELESDEEGRRGRARARARAPRGRHAEKEEQSKGFYAERDERSAESDEVRTRGGGTGGLRQDAVPSRYTSLRT